MSAAHAIAAWDAVGRVADGAALTLLIPLGLLVVVLAVAWWLHRRGQHPERSEHGY